MKRAPACWTQAEQKILREVYARAGSHACVQALPHRTLAAIYARVQAMGLRAPTQERNRKWRATPDIDAQIRQGYTQTPKRGYTTALAARLRMPAWWVKRRAAVLGLSMLRLKPPDWAPEEEDFLLAHAHLSLRALQRAMRRARWLRSETAISVKLKRLGTCPAQARADAGVYSATQLARLLGLEPCTVARWIEHEALPAKAAGTRRLPSQGGDEYRICIRRLRKWMKSHWQLIDLRKIDKHWFFDVVYPR